MTGRGGEYGPGWAWHVESGVPVHLQADWPVEQTGWYGLRATTAGGRVLVSEEVRWDAESAVSRALTVARLEGPGTRWEHRGYGEEMPLSEVRLPFEGDHWWYPRRTYWRVRAEFGGERRELVGGREEDANGRFRATSTTPEKLIRCREPIHAGAHVLRGLGVAQPRELSFGGDDGLTDHASRHG